MAHPPKDEIHLDQRGDGFYSGTFRWTDQKRFPPLPQRTPRRSSVEPLSQGWKGYLEKCHSVNLIPLASQDPSFLDALSFPMTLVYAATALQLHKEWEESVHVLIIGATVKAEQRILRQTRYWDEIAAFFPDVSKINLWFIGPEVSTELDLPATSPRLKVRFVRSTAGEFLAAHSGEFTSKNAVIIGYNTGFGNFVESSRYDLFWSWLPDLMAIADSGLPGIFACANDYADLNGEFAIHTRVIGSKMLLLPKENPFSAASHLHEEGKKDTAWSRANSFMYAVQGFDPSRRVKLCHGDLIHLNALLDHDMRDLHMQDRLGRHFLNGVIMSKEQAAQYLKSTDNGANKLNAAAASMEVLSVHDRGDNQTSHQVSAPAYSMTTDNSKLCIRIETPLMASARLMQLEVAPKTLRLFVPDLYDLKVDLPFVVACEREAVHAKFSTKTRTLFVDLHAAT
ncbi:hypothetical protein LEN26_011551 [Aphanomyces euteiches]|nr:hypothetical protein AeMF1_010261 [Aphanomyces euteiches]KAH9119593.1 hypothetical protein LEN26_011551 [Aphanomyces euteiches]KAH9191237.1 hypothetical protein AeNC1_006786 [Aphanomyces euteiches]